VKRPKTDLKEFRQNVAKLKKAGLIPPKNRSGKPVKTSQARPTDLVYGKTLSQYVNNPKNREVLSGEAVTLPASKIKDSEGFTRRKVPGGSDRIIVTGVPEGAKVTAEKGKISFGFSSASGSVKRIQVPRKEMIQYLEDASSLPELKPGARYAFYYYGNRSYLTFESPEHLQEEIMAYKSAQENKHEAFQHLEIVELSPPAVEEWRAAINERQKRKRRGGRRSAAKRRIENIPQYKLPGVRATRAASMRRYRARKGR